MPTALYCRSSIDSQEHSIEMQRTVAYFAAANRATLIDEEHVYIDEAVSARKTKIDERPALTSLVRQIQAGKISTLFVYKRDRLARNVQQHLELYELLKKYKVEVVFSAGNELAMTYTPAGEFFELIIAGFNEREASQIALRIKETKQAMFLLGKNHGSKLPYGYYSDQNKEIQRDENKLKDVLFVFNQLMSTDCRTFSDFCRYLQSASTVPKDLLNYQRLKKIIESKEYMGIRTAKFDGDVIEIEKKSLVILSEEEWNQAQDKMKMLIRKRKTDDGSEDSGILDDLVYCGACHTPAKRKKVKIASREEKVYICPVHYRHKAIVSRLEEIVLDRVEQWIEQLALAQESELFKEVLSKIINESQIKLLRYETNLPILRSKIDEITNKWLESKDEDLEGEMFRLYESQAQLLKQITVTNDLIQAITQYPERIRKLWEQVTGEIKLSGMKHSYQRELLRDVVNQISIQSPPNVSIELKNPWVEFMDGGNGLAFKVSD
ncbi:recombinase family protein [Paenibacillus odorifer]|uniref:recombinase family protein n=1 Tax=Paenibacillus odorifer TaxID=189426 RepID=UPI0009700A41|nr:recombinase family protein [Paenibacillus odorifer]OMD06634.1 hypothetical protein BJP47_13610 [Paenibacillus odorifer]